MALASALNMTGLDASKGSASIAGRIYFATDTLKLYYDTGSAWTPYTFGSAIVRTKALLSADVTMTSANTGYDGPSITPVAGTHTIWANVTVENTTGAGTFTAKLWDGTTVLASGGFTAGGATYVGTIPLLWEVVASGSTAYKVTVLCNVTGGLIKAAAPVNGAGNNATTIYSLQVA